MSQTLKPVIKELGAGLILRRSSSEDAEALAAFCGEIHSEIEGEPDPIVAAWTHDLLTRPHPRFHHDDFTVIEEAATGRIVSTLNLIAQTWTYEGIPFEVGRPELVGTLPEFRNRGLVRLQFEEIHRWSAERNELVQAITGIPFYYRLFGYEMAIDLDGSRSGFEVNVPELGSGAVETCSFRPATEADVPFIAEVYRHGCQRSPIACVRDEDIWQYELRDRSEIVRQATLIIQGIGSERLGVLRHWQRLMRRGTTVTLFELKPGTPWLELAPAVVRYMWKTGQEYARREGKPCMAFNFALGESHPVYEVFRDGLPHIQKSYAWYVRVPDLPRFLKHIAPALDKRLAVSLACGFTGKVHISFYRSGLRLAFEQGQLTGVEPWMPGPRELEGDIAFPGLTFLQLVFGYRSFDELSASFPDCWCKSHETRLLMEALFPKRSSEVLALS